MRVVEIIATWTAQPLYNISDTLVYPLLLGGILSLYSFLIISLIVFYMDKKKDVEISKNALISLDKK